MQFDNMRSKKNPFLITCMAWLWLFSRWPAFFWLQFRKLFLFWKALNRMLKVKYIMKHFPEQGLLILCGTVTQWWLGASFAGSTVFGLSHKLDVLIYGGHLQGGFESCSRYIPRLANCILSIKMFFAASFGEATPYLQSQTVFFW